jgi:hypothetical protein
LENPVSLFSSSGIVPPHLIFSYVRREQDQGKEYHKERVEVRGHSFSRVQGRIRGSSNKPQATRQENPPLVPPSRYAAETSWQVNCLIRKKEQQSL